MFIVQRFEKFGDGFQGRSADVSQRRRRMQSPFAVLMSQLPYQPVNGFQDT